MKELTPYFLRSVPPAQGESASPPGAVLEGEPLHLWDYWQVVRKHGFLIVVCFLLTVVTVAIRTFITTPIYMAETTLLIERKAPRVLDLRDAQGDGGFDYDEYDYYRTQYEILKSRGLAAQVIRVQSLDTNSAFVGKKAEPGPLGRLWDEILSWPRELLAAVSPVPPPQKLEATALEVKPELLGAYLGGLDIRPVPRTRLVKIAFRSPDPALSAAVANAHARAYIRHGAELRSETNKEGLQFLEEKLVELKERVEKAEVALNHYRREKGIISLDDKENIIVDRLADLNTRLTEAEAERIGWEAQVQTLRQGGRALPVLAQNTLVKSLTEQLAKAEAEVAHLASQFKADYPPLKQLQAQEEEIRRRLHQEEQRATDGVTSAYQAALRKEKELRAKMDEQRTATLSLKDASVAYAVLSREVDTNRQLYDSVLQRIKEMGVATEMRTSNVSIIDQASLPRLPISPNKRANLLFGVLLGLLSGVGLAFFFEYLDNTIKTPDQAERELGLPNLSVVPHFGSLQGASAREESGMVQDVRQQLLAWKRWGKQQLGGESVSGTASNQIIVAYHPLSVVSEAYRTLRAGILLSRAEEPPRTLLFTSGVHAEGKTSTTLNTAVTFAQMGVRVLVIDADLRRPSCHKALGMKGGPGLSEVLTGQRKVERLIKRTTVDNLHLLSSGTIPPNPAELIGSIKMHEVLTALRTQFDYVFIDSPPVMPVSDALLLAKMVDGVVMVIGGQETPKKVVKEARARLTYARAKILGTVLNKVDLQRSGYYYHNYYYYSSHYHRSEEAEGE